MLPHTGSRRFAGHADMDMTADYTFVDIERQQELTRAIQERLARARADKGQPVSHQNPAPEVPPTPATPQDQNPPLEQMPCASSFVQ